MLVCSNSIFVEDLYLVMVYIYGGGYEIGIFVVLLGDVIFLWGVVLVII